MQLYLDQALELSRESGTPKPQMYSAKGQVSRPLPPLSKDHLCP